MKFPARAWLYAALSIPLFALTTAWGAPLPAATPEDAGISSQRLERLTQTMQRLVDTGELAGMVVMVARRSTTPCPPSARSRYRICCATPPA